MLGEKIDIHRIEAVILAGPTALWVDWQELGPDREEDWRTR